MSGGYLLGHTARELERLDVQGGIYHDFTRRALTDAGVASGMKVLDLGTGSGDVALLAAELVGRAGLVVGVDLHPVPVAAAAERARRRRVDNVLFRVAEAGALLDEAPFDAVVGRFVLMHQSDPAAVLGAALRNARRGALVVFIESCMGMLRAGAHSHPHSALYEAVVRWMCDVVSAAGADLWCGLRLPGTFAGAGLPTPVTRLEAPVECGPRSRFWEYVEESARSMRPEALSRGVAGLEGGVEGLGERLREDVVARGGAVVGWPVVAAWATAP